jgi:hypothetical protein
VQDHSHIGRGIFGDCRPAANDFLANATIVAMTARRRCGVS